MTPHADPVSTRAVTFLAERFASGLIHPGTETQKPFAIPLPGLRAIGIPPEMAQQFASDADMPSTDTPRLVGEAVVHTMTTEGGFTIVDTAELDELRKQAADAPDGTRVVELVCNCHGKPVFELTVDKHDKRQVNVKHLAMALEQHEAAG